MAASLLNGGDENVVGWDHDQWSAHLQEVYGEDRGVKYPEIISGHTAHAGWNKACEMFGIRLVQSTGYLLDHQQR